MNKLLALAGGILLLGIPGPGTATAGTLFTNPVLYLAPMVVNFGPVATNTSANAAVLVENMGVGKLVGTATVSAPFKIVAGGNYALKANETQVITISYTPRGTAPDSATVKFTGGGGGSATVTGIPVPPPRKLLTR